jgi:hypothetical protein
MVDAGLDAVLDRDAVLDGDALLDGVLAAARSLAAEVDVNVLDATEATRLVVQCAEAERLLAAVRVLATRVLQDKAMWRREGFRSAAAWMASQTGTLVGAAIASMEMAEQLDDLPAVAEAFRAGRLSEAQARAIAEVASDVPDAQERLLEAAGKLTLQGLREECRRVRAAASVDEDARHRRVHRGRYLRSWMDKDGAVRVSARLTADEGARLLAEVDRRRDEMVVDAVKGRWFESLEAHRVDALVDLARPDSATAPGPESMVHVLVDHEALMRGHTVAGETCEIPGIGPIPVSLARRLSEDSILKVLLTKGVDIVAVAHGGRTIPAHLRTALEVRDPKCIVPRCDVRRRLEIDHTGNWARTRNTSLENSGRLCKWHHYQKTFLGYTYRGGPGTWQWIPPDDRDQDFTNLSKIIRIRRC